MSTRPVNVAALADLDPEEFLRIIELNLPYGHPVSPEGHRRLQLWGALTGADLVSRTYAALGMLLRRVEDDIASRKAEIAAYKQECHDRGEPGRKEFLRAVTEHDLWRRGAVARRALIIRRHDDVKAIIRSYHDAGNPVQGVPRKTPPKPNPAKHRANTDTMFRLALAISDHRDAYDRAGILPSEADLALWEMLEQLTTLTQDGPITLEKFLDDVTSKPDFVHPDDR